MGRVLVVDDDRSIRDLISEVLVDSGYQIELAENGQKAVEVARSAQPCVILMDLMMPVMDGATAIALLKNDPATNWIQIVAMSAGINLHKQTGRLIMADGLLAKPFDLETLLAQIELCSLQAKQARPSPGG